MGVGVGADIRIECSLPPLPTLSLAIPLPPLINFKLPTLTLNFILTIKCPELPGEWLAKLDEMLNLELPFDRPSLDLDLSKYSVNAGGSATLNLQGGSDHWSYEPL